MSWVLITGGAKKLGSALSLSISEKHPVVIHYRKSESEAKEIQKIIQKKGGKAEILFGDFSEEAGTLSFIKEYEKRFPETEAFIHNASCYHFGSFLSTTSQQGKELLHVNFFTAHLLAEKLQGSIKKKKGAIIHIGVAGLPQTLSDTRTSFYTLSKLSLWMLTKSLAKELAPFGVRVNMVSPGYLEDSIDHPKEPSLLPMGRLGKAEEIVRTVLFLLEPQNAYITGQNIEVAGGVRL